MTIQPCHSSRTLAALATALAYKAAIPSTNAFSSPSTPLSSFLHPISPTSSSSSSSTQLYIIGPMIRKMREKNDGKNMPMASSSEAKFEAPGLRVGAQAWKWPPVWPYDANFFKRTVEIEAMGKNSQSPLSQMMGGASMGADDPSTKGDVNAVGIAGGEDQLFDSLKFWEEKSEVRTELDKRVAEKITNHYSFYLRNDMSVLELGAATNSYLPSDLKLQKHVGVGAVQSLLDVNPSLTDSMVVDLNKVTDGVGIDSQQFGVLCNEEFDAVIMANTIDFLNHPREVFKSSWQALKPGGIMMVPFLAKDAYADKFDEAFTKQWRDMTDDQHMWVCGSFFQFSAGDGWESLKGFDISPDGARKEGEGNILSKLQQSDESDKPCSAFVVQAKKKVMAEYVEDADSILEFIKSRLWMMPTLEDRDKKLVAPRLSRAYDILHTEEDKKRMMQHFDSLPKVYASLVKMDSFAFTFSMQAQLAADLMGDPDFEGNDLQINNMKMGLGLRKPSKDFWAPVGKLTAAMTPEDKVNLLAHIVPRFGSGNIAQEEALGAFVTGLEPTFALVRTKCPSMKEADVQLLGTELLASEVLAQRSTREEFAFWLGALSQAELELILTKRKSFKEEATQELAEFQETRNAEEKRVEERRKKIREQIELARENRYVFFNARTGKMEELEKQRGGFKMPWV